MSIEAKFFVLSEAAHHNASNQPAKGEHIGEELSLLQNDFWFLAEWRFDKFLQHGKRQYGMEGMQFYLR